MKKKSKKRIFTVIIALVLAAAGGLFAAFRLKAPGSKAKSVTYTVHSETVTNIIEIAGAIAAAKEQNLQAPGDGTVTAVYVREGDKVKQGQVVLQMDDSEQRYNLAKHDYDMEQKRLSGAPRDVQLMEHQRGVLVQKMKDRQIIANFDGVIAELTASAGDVFEAKDSAGVIIDRSYLVATVEVVETDAPKLKAGQKVSMKFPAAPDQAIEGVVDSFPATASKSSRGASVVKAEIRVDNPPEIILPYYSFTGEIEISPPETLLLVEREAIGYKRPEGAPSKDAPSKDALSKGGPGAGGPPPEGPPSLEGAPSGRRPSGNADASTGRMPPNGAPQAGSRPSNGGGPAADGSGGGMGGRGAGRGIAFADKVKADGSVERVDVRVIPYGSEFVRIVSGLAEGDVLAAQETPRASGWNSANRASGQNANQRTDQNTRRQQMTPVMPMMPGGAPPGGGGPGPR